MRSLEINLILWPPISGFPRISTYIDCTHYLGLSVLPGRCSDIWQELNNLTTTESNTSYIGTSATMRSCETWTWDLMRLGLIESHENSHLTRVILKKISISRKHTRQDWDPTLVLVHLSLGIRYWTVLVHFSILGHLLSHFTFLSSLWLDLNSLWLNCTALLYLMPPSYLLLSTMYVVGRGRW